MNLTKILLILLFFTLPLIHGGIFATIGIDFKFVVSGNFEFTKSLFFNILSSLIFISFCIDSFFEDKKPLSLNLGKEFRLGGIMGAIVLILLLSTLFSFSPFTSLIGDDNKGHTALLFFNLLGLFVVIRSLDQIFLKKLIYTSLLSGVCVSFLGVKELYSPTFNYGHLADRALGSFGHPNYFAGFLLLLLPLSTNFVSLASFSKGSSPKGGWIHIGVTIVLLSGILLSKSIVAVVLALGFLGVSLAQTHLGISSLFKRKGLQLSILSGILISGIIFASLIILYLPEKLHSFLSRFYLWETTLSIIFSNWKIFLFGGGLETLSYVFESFKSPEVYIYENFGFTADRPHNFFLNIFYHFGVLGLGMLSYLVFTFLSFCKRGYPKGEELLNTCRIVIILFLLFGIIHFFSIASYLVVILCIVFFLHPKSQQDTSIQLSPAKRKSELQYIASSLLQETRGIAKQERVPWGRIERGVLGAIVVLFTLLSLLGAYYSLQFYKAEILYTQKDISSAKNLFSHPKYLIAEGRYDDAEKIEGLYSVISYKRQIQDFPEKETLCLVFTEELPSAENYFYCGAIFELLGNKELSLEYYAQGLSLLPDLWNEDSPYWDNYFIKNTITGNRFFSEKFGDIGAVLEKVEK